MSGGVDMLNKAFLYNYEKNEWAPCTDTKYIESEIEDLPCTVIVEYSGDWCPNYRYWNTDYIFCLQHNTMEEVEDVYNGKVVSVDGCIFRGLVRKAVFNINYDEESNTVYLPFRWRIFQRKPPYLINIACDVLQTRYCRNGVIRRWINFAFSVDFMKNKVRVTKVKKGSQSYDWTETDVEIPDIVVNTAVEAMREGTFCSCGIKPSVLSQMRGKNKVMAYLERPFDLNVVYLKKFLREFTHNDDGKDIFDQVFPRDQKDNYKVICKLLDINPPKSLRKAYSFNPYSIVLYMIFKQWNINDINYMQRFFYLDDCLSNMLLHRFYYDRKHKRVTRTQDENLEHWKAMEFYYKWIKEMKGEKHLIKLLYHVSAEESLFDWQIDIVMAFFHYYDSLSAEIKERLLSDGMTDYVHNAISMEITALSEKWENTPISYNAEILRYECKIKDCEFKLVHNTGMLPALGAAFNNCVATYRQRVLDHNSIIIYAMNKLKYVACIEIDDNKHIVQATGKYNEPLKDEIRRICCYWAKRNNLVIDVPNMENLSLEEMEGFNDTIIGNIPYEKSYEKMDLEDFSTKRDKAIQEGIFNLRRRAAMGEFG